MAKTLAERKAIAAASRTAMLRRVHERLAAVRDRKAGAGQDVTAEDGQLAAIRAEIDSIR